MEAANLADLELRLRRLGLDLVHGTPVRQITWQRQRSISRRELINFCFHLEQFLRAGVPIIDSLADLRDSLHRTRFRQVIGDVVEAIEGGLGLSQALQLQTRYPLWREWRRPWKLFALACGIGLLVIGRYLMPAPDWDIPISFIMGLMAYACASWCLRVFLARDWLMWPLALFLTWFTIDGCLRSSCDALAPHWTCREENAAWPSNRH